MKFPAFWAKGEAEETDYEDIPVYAACWGWSDVSIADAKQNAQARAEKLAKKMAQGDTFPSSHYGYGRAPMREEVIQKVAGSDENPTAVITQNNYGVLVLNTSRAMFVDLDFDCSKFPRPGLFSWLFKPKQEGPSPEQQQEAKIKQRVEDFLRAHRNWGLRMYRTCAGIRLLVTHDLFDPQSQETLEVLRALGSDPLLSNFARRSNVFGLGSPPSRGGVGTMQVGSPGREKRRRPRTNIANGRVNMNKMRKATQLAGSWKPWVLATSIPSWKSLFACMTI